MNIIFNEESKEQKSVEDYESESNSEELKASTKVSTQRYIYIYIYIWIQIIYRLIVNEEIEELSDDQCASLLINSLQRLPSNIQESVQIYFTKVNIRFY